MQIGVEASRAVGNKRVFVIDDDEITRAVLQFMLQDDNEAHDLPSVDGALRKAQDWPPDLVLLGLSIVQSDPQVLTEIGRQLPDTAIVLVAEAGQAAAAQRWIGHGARGVLSKPLTVEGVRRTVDGTLGLLKSPLIQLQVL